MWQVTQGGEGKPPKMAFQPVQAQHFPTCRFLSRRDFGKVPVDEFAHRGAFTF
jgi:hypothetical protein